MGHIPAPHLTLIAALNRLEAEVVNDYTGAYGDNSAALSTAITDTLDALVELMGASAVSDLVDDYVEE